VDEQYQRLRVEAQACEGSGVGDVIPLLQFGEMISAADSSQRCVVDSRRDVAIREPGESVAIPRAVEVRDFFGLWVELHFAALQCGAVETHAAADVVSDQVRVECSAGDERGADGAVLSGVQIRKADGGAHVGQSGGTTELRNCVSFDPVLLRGENADITGNFRTHTISDPTLPGGNGTPGDERKLRFREWDATRGPAANHRFAQA